MPSSLPKTPPKAVLLLSGGLDSATCLALARREGFEVHALSFRYGQRHAVELEAARRIAALQGAARHVILDLDLRAFGGSSLTSDALDVPKTGLTPGIPSTYVPARNTVFLSLALAWAETLEARDLFIGVNAVDFSGYPDCRPAFIQSFESLANVATKAGVEGHPFRIHAPLLHWSKEEIIRQGLALGVDFALTRSCYDPDSDGIPCGLCDSCRLRREGFARVGVEDPASPLHRRVEFGKSLGLDVGLPGIFRPSGDG
ncbi:MAG: 7-cyano-7-deazaguanine synthase QueC [Magnetococcales bacterium]|nr:7-cyano-7-deazaguanine synthase QueC [Magnetococcales bacterium]